MNNRLIALVLLIIILVFLSYSVTKEGFQTWKWVWNIPTRDIYPPLTYDFRGNPYRYVYPYGHAYYYYPSKYLYVSSNNPFTNYNYNYNYGYPTMYHPYFYETSNPYYFPYYRPNFIRKK